MADPNYIPEDQREPVQNIDIPLDMYLTATYSSFPTMHVDLIEIINNQSHRVKIEGNYTNGRLLIVLLEE
jgi:hypothetical protein